MKVIILVLLFLNMAFVTESMARTTIKVGAYDYPPFIEWTDSHPEGLLLDLLNIMNRVQDKYAFTLVETTANRRYHDLDRDYFDVIFFEDALWGWDKSKVAMSDIFLTGSEVFIAKNKAGRNQSYFENLMNKRIRAFLGYHYSFLNYSNDPQFLKKWNLEFTNSHFGNIQAVLNDRADLAIITKEYLSLVLKENKDYKSKLLISNKPDQTYKMGAVFKINDKLKTDEMNDLLEKVEQDPKFKSVFLEL